jgi:SHS family lactate transporter-like MFS transporter
MAIAAESAQVAWWREPTREQWHAWIAAWLGWTLDAFDFTIFLLIMLPISQEFHVPLVDVTAVLALTCGCGWSARRCRVGSPTGWVARSR